VVALAYAWSIWTSSGWALRDSMRVLLYGSSQVPSRSTRRLVPVFVTSPPRCYEMDGLEGCDTQGVSTSSDIAPSDLAAASPNLPTFTSAYLKVDDVQYQFPADIRSATVLEDWIIQVEDALTEARNGVTAIAWPFVLAGLVGSLVILADVAESAHNFWTGFADSPYRTVVGLVLLCASIGAFVLTDQTTKNRKRLVTIRHAYLRRRRELVEGNPDLENEAATQPSATHD